MSIVQEQLEELLTTEGYYPDTIEDLGYDNFSLQWKNKSEKEVERLAESLDNDGLEGVSDVTYDDEGGDIIVHFEGLDDEKSIRAELKTILTKKVMQKLKKKGIV